MRSPRRFAAIAALYTMTLAAGCTGRQAPPPEKKAEVENLAASYSEPTVNDVSVVPGCRLVTSELALDTDGTLYAAHQDRNPIISRMDPVGYLTHDWGPAEGPVRQIFITSGVVVARIELVRGSKIVKFDNGGRSTDLFFWPSTGGKLAIAPDGTLALFAHIGGPVDGGVKTLTFFDLNGNQVRQAAVSFCGGENQLLFKPDGTAVLFSNRGSGGTEPVMSRVPPGATENTPWSPVHGARYEIDRNGALVGWNIVLQPALTVTLVRLTEKNEAQTFPVTMADPIYEILLDKRDHLVGITRSAKNNRASGACRISSDGKETRQLWVATSSSVVNATMPAVSDRELVLLTIEERDGVRTHALQRFEYRDK